MGNIYVGISLRTSFVCVKILEILHTPKRNFFNFLVLLTSFSPKTVTTLRIKSLGVTKLRGSSFNLQGHRTLKRYRGLLVTTKVDYLNV